jgi:hypothetical protein
LEEYAALENKGTDIGKINGAAGGAVGYGDP